MSRSILLAKRPDLIFKLDKYGIELPRKKNGAYRGIAKKWAAESRPPYDRPLYQALAMRLEEGWEEIDEKELNELINRSREAIVQKKRGKPEAPNYGNGALAENVIKVALLIIAIAANMVTKEGIGRIKKMELYEKRQVIGLQFELICGFLTGSRLFELFFENVADLFVVDEEEKKSVAAILSLAAYLAAFLGASAKKSEKKELYLALKDPLLRAIEKAKVFLDKKVTGRGSPAAQKVRLYLREAAIALKQEDFDGFNEALTASLEFLGIEEEAFYRLLSSLDNVADNIRYALTEGMEDLTQKFTTISQAM